MGQGGRFISQPQELTKGGLSHLGAGCGHPGRAPIALSPGTGDTSNDSASSPL